VSAANPSRRAVLLWFAALTASLPIPFALK
jgi:hypothetical protein